MASPPVPPPDIAACALDPQVVAQAADWLIHLLPGGDASVADACLRWRAEKPEHELAWQRMVAIQGSLQQHAERIDGQTASHAVGQGVRAERARRRTLKWMAGIAGVGVVTWAGRESLPWRAWRAQYHTDTGERRQLALEDGTTVLLNTRSALDVVFDADTRRLDLLSGEILVATGRDARPLVVATRNGLIRPIGTRFTVRNLDASRHDTQVAVFEGSVMVEPARAPGAAQRVEAGQQAHFGADAASPPVRAGATAGAWADGVLAAQGMRLDDFLDELGRYRPGLLQASPDIAHLRVTGVFPLDDTDQALRTLEEIFPVRVVRRTRLWLTVRPRAEKL